MNRQVAVILCVVSCVIGLSVIGDHFGVEKMVLDSGALAIGLIGALILRFL